MAIQVCYFKDFSDEKKIVDILSTIYSVDKHFISNLESGSDVLNFEFKKFNSKSDFNVQLEIFLDYKTILKTKIYNNLILALKLVDLLKLDILINDESDDPYQWLLLNKYKKLFLVEQSSLNEFDDGIDIVGSKLELNLSKAIRFLPQKDDIVNLDCDKPYFISNSKKWLSICKNS